MKVLQIVGCRLHSGGGRGVLALHEMLMEQGVDSRILGRIESDLPPELHASPISLRHRLPVSLLNRWYLWRLRKRFGELPKDFHPISYGLDLHKLPAYQDADIIHIQWVNATSVGPAFWRALKNEKRPIIWTLRDMWPFTGGCHFSANCQRYTTGCGQCPLLGGQFDETLTSADVIFKASHMSDKIVFVAISRQTADQARRSFILKNHDIRVISNSVLLDRFQAINKDDARRALGLPPGKFMIATGALTLSNPRKGSEVLAQLLNSYRNDDKIHWVIFGGGLENVLSPVPENCTSFGLVDDDTLLNRIYAAADVFAMPSLHETFGQVTVEAMASGTAVIAYDNTPAEEMIRHGETGWLVPHGDGAAFHAAVEQARSLGDDVLAEKGKSARKDALERFSLDAVTQQHIELYQELLLEKKSSRNVPDV